MDLEAEISIPSIPQQAYQQLHDNSAKLKLINGTPVSAVEEAAAAVVAASRAGPAGVGFGEAQVQVPAPASAVPAPAPLAAVAAPGVGGGSAAPPGGGAATPGVPGSNGNSKESSKKPVRYRECQKNHAAGIGAHALDGCGEFMPSGEEGSIDALKCSACDCHRNFHRREVEGEVIPTPTPPSEWFKTPGSGGGGGTGKKKHPPGGTLLSPLAAITPGGASAGRSPGGTTLMALSGSDQSDEQDAAAAAAFAASAQHNSAFALAHHLIPSAIRKRFRTKFTGEQKEKMFMFAERLGWKIQKHDEAEVQQFCADVGVKRHVLKVWMHNNKNTFAKKLN